MVDRELRKKILHRLGVQQPALSKKAKKLKRVLAEITTDEAVWVIAHRGKIDLRPYLAKEKLRRVDELNARLIELEGSRFAFGPTSTPARGKSLGSPKIFKFPNGTHVDLPVLSDQVKAQAVEMARIYPLLYLLENSIRAFIVKAMEKYFGSDWWNQKVPSKLKSNVESLKGREVRNAWHQCRSARDIDYLDFKDLSVLITKMEDHLLKDSILPARGWLQSLIDELYVPRCVLCHMNPLDKHSINVVKVDFEKWRKQIESACQLL